MSSASESDERGQFTISNEDLAACLDMDEERLLAVISAMEGRFIENKQIINWEKRQPKREDNSTERTKAWRERKKTTCDADVTQGDAPDTDTDTDTDTDNNQIKRKRNATSLTSFEKQFGEYPTIISNELWSYGKERGLDADRVESVWTAFCDWHVAKNSKWAGSRGWKLAWGNWCARQTDRQPSQQRGGNSQQPSKLAAISSQVLAGMLDKQGMAGGAAGTHAGTGTANTAGHDGNLQAMEASEPEWLRG